MSELREALTSAYDEAAAKEPETEATPAPVTQTASTEPVEAESASTPTESAEAEGTQEKLAPGTSDRPRDTTGKFLKADKPKAAASTTATKPPEQPMTGAKTGTAPPKPAESTATRPPQSWKPTERDAWAKVPPEAQAAIARREAEISKALSESAPLRQTGEAFSRMIAPYEGLIRSQGGEPLKTVENAVQTLYALHTAPAGHKATIAANIISQFGIDPAHVAQVLQGQAPQGGQQQMDPNAFASQLRQAGFLTKEDLQQQQLHGLAQQYAQKWEAFAAKNEFAEDLKPTIAKLIESGVAEDFQDAYDLAAHKDASVRAALEQREEAKQANAARASTQRSRAASSSLKSSPAGPTGGPQPKGVRGTLESVYDKLSGMQR